MGYTMNKRNEWFGDRMRSRCAGTSRPDRDGPPAPAPVLHAGLVPFSQVVFLLIAWFVPMKIWLGRIIWPPVKRGPTDAYAFMALAYEGVSAKTNEVSPGAFASRSTR
jgi:hypothetical protein